MVTNINKNDYNNYFICYQIEKNRYCHNIGRQHKSNRIMLEVNLCQKFLFQSCWDNDCKGYKSNPIPGQF